MSFYEIGPYKASESADFLAFWVSRSQDQVQAQQSRIVSASTDSDWCYTGSARVKEVVT